MTSPDPLLAQALTAIDAAHVLDPTPHTTSSGGSSTTIPYELHYAQKCTHYLSLHTPSPSPTLQLAVRAQHFRRWEVPRDTFPKTKPGYFAWRTHLKKRQAEQVEALLREVGWGSEAERERVGALIRKEGLVKGEGKESEEEVQALEDVACLVFLDDQFDAFEREHDEEKIVGILRKTWAKMGSRGKEMVSGGELVVSERAREMVGRALRG
jgi:hypothetical protein